jgi:hypothetical protein
MGSEQMSPRRKVRVERWQDTMMTEPKLAQASEGSLDELEVLISFALSVFLFSIFARI